LDLSCWDLAFSGAEPVRAETLEKFAKIFAPCGFRKEAFYPCYGMAEATLFISGGLKAESPIIKYVDGKALEENRIVEIADPKAKAIVGCGRIWQGYQIAIVDPDTLNKCPEGTVGEIWVMGAGIGKGYWQQSEETAKTFQAYIKNTGEGPFLRTGDFGFLDGQELYITGRLKEIMILWGRNQYPQHIERTVQKSHPSFSIEVGDEERLVIAQELERTHLKNFNLEEIVGAIRLAIAQEHLAEVYAIALLKTGTIPKTSSGKIQRRGCRALFLEGNLEAIARWQNQDNQPSDITQMASIS
jgi:acyl-CoA synthetase (AMP-forming)/AMP-acid ligase II